MNIAQDHILRSRVKSPKPSVNRFNIVPRQVNTKNLVLRDSSKLGRVNNKHQNPRQSSKSRLPGQGWQRNKEKVKSEKSKHLIVFSTVSKNKWISLKSLSLISTGALYW